MAEVGGCLKIRALHCQEAGKGYLHSVTSNWLCLEVLQATKPLASTWGPAIPATEAGSGAWSLAESQTVPSRGCGSLKT